MKKKMAAEKRIRKAGAVFAAGLFLCSRACMYVSAAEIVYPVLDGTLPNEGNTTGMPARDQTAADTDNIQTGNNITGTQQTGWIQRDGRTYYISPELQKYRFGWQRIEGKTYYFHPKTWELQTGWQKIEGKTYYLQPKTGELQTGWQKIEGKTYYLQPETGELQTDWQEIGEGLYYLQPETGELQTGWQKIEGDTYYFYPQTGELQTGWQEIDGDTYYFSESTGRMLTGRQGVGQKAYFFNKEGILQTSGWIESGGRKYYAGETGVLKTGWQEIDGGRYFFSKENNRVLTGQQEIDGSYYIFSAAGRLARSGDICLVRVGKKAYCAGKNGKAAGGWHVIDGDLYYASKTGKVKQNTTYEGITFTSSGKAKQNAAANLKITAMRILSSLVNPEASKSQKLSACWSYITGGNFRYAVKYPDLGVSGWQRETAYDMLSTRSGNCYSFACAFAALAKEAGYDPFIVCGRVRGSRDRARDGYTRHAWVRINGLYYDPEGQYAGWLRGVYGRAAYPTAHTVQKIIRY